MLVSSLQQLIFYLYVQCLLCLLQVPIQIELCELIGQHFSSHFENILVLSTVHHAKLNKKRARDIEMYIY